jgi:signal recognition particle receptor subunit beta
MALFDPERKRIVIRVVYDGPGHAGKTTNLQRLSSSFAAWRRSDLVSPATIGERTQYFDWLEVDGGLLRSYPIRAQLLTVPGQRELTLRRKFVIERADVVVFVADSQAEGLDEARAFYAELCEQLDAFPVPVPIILQANKQDLPGAIKPPALARLISAGLRAPDQIKGSVASNNDGVKQTLAVALRLGSEAVRKLWASEDPTAMAGEIEDHEAAFAALTHHESQRQSGRPSVPAPTLPSTQLPSTQLWPPVSGRALLQALDGKPTRRIPTPERPDRCVFEVDGWRLSSGSAQFYSSTEAALTAMLALTRRKVALGAWLPEPAAVAVVPGPEHAGAWLWTIEPVLPSLAEQLADRDPDRRRDALSTFAEILVGAEALAERAGLLVDLDPAAFALQTGDRIRTRYLGERLEPGRAPATVAAIVDQAERHANDPAALGDFTEILCLGFHYAPVDSERRASLIAELDAVDIEHPAARQACDAAQQILARPAHT